MGVRDSVIQGDQKLTFSSEQIYYMGFCGRIDAAIYHR